LKNLSEIEMMISPSVAELRNSVDLSVEYLKANPSQKRQVNELWENFLFDFVEYVKQKEKDSGEELINLPLSKLIKLLK